MKRRVREQDVEVRCAQLGDVVALAELLREAGSTPGADGRPLWHPDEVSEQAIGADLESFRVFEVEGELAGTMMFLLEDAVYWPEMTESDSAYIHRVAVTRKFAGSGLSSWMLSWARSESIRFGRTCLRLDCDAARGRLRQFYTEMGFLCRDEREVNGLRVARFEQYLGEAGCG